MSNLLSTELAQFERNCVPAVAVCHCSVLHSLFQTCAPLAREEVQSVLAALLCCTLQQTYRIALRFPTPTPTPHTPG